MQLKRKIGLIAAGLITLSGVSIIEEIYVYGNEKNKSNIQLEEYEIKDLANLIGKNKIDVENVLGKGYEKEILQQESNVYIGFDEKREVASLINISFVEDDESTYRIISERLWNELGKSSLKFVSSDNKVIETWNKGDLEINFNNESVLNDAKVPSDTKLLKYDGTMLSLLNLKTEDLTFNVSFNLNIVDITGKTVTCKIELKLPNEKLEEEGTSIVRQDISNYVFSIKK